jgi:hypothetical protein
MAPIARRSATTTPADRLNAHGAPNTAQKMPRCYRLGIQLLLLIYRFEVRIVDACIVGVVRRAAGLVGRDGDASRGAGDPGRDPGMRTILLNFMLKVGEGVTIPEAASRTIAVESIISSKPEISHATVTAVTLLSPVYAIKFNRGDCPQRSP